MRLINSILDFPGMGTSQAAPPGLRTWGFGPHSSCSESSGGWKTTMAPTAGGPSFTSTLALRALTQNSPLLLREIPHPVPPVSLRFAYGSATRYGRNRVGSFPEQKWGVLRERAQGQGARERGSAGRGRHCGLPPTRRLTAGRVWAEAPRSQT